MSKDIRIKWDFNLIEGDFDFDSSIQDLESDEGFETAVLISLFSDRRAKKDDILPDPNNPDKRGWWGDLVSDNDLIGSRLWLLDREKTTENVLIKAKQYCQEALQWLIDDGAAAKVEIKTERQGTVENARLVIGIKIYKIDGNVEVFNFEPQWIAQGYRPESRQVMTSIPIVTTQPVSDIVSTACTGNGDITYLGAVNPTQHGVCWGTSPFPTISDNKTEEGIATSPGPFTSNITGLTDGVTYYVRAYVTNTFGTVYGENVEIPLSILPSVSTRVVLHEFDEITGLTAVDKEGNFNITLEGFADDDSQWLNPGIKLNGTDERLDPNTTYPAYFNANHTIRIKYIDNIDTTYVLGGCANAIGDKGIYEIQNSLGTLIVYCRTPLDLAYGVDGDGLYGSLNNDVFTNDGLQHELIIRIKQGVSAGITCWKDRVLIPPSVAAGNVGDMNSVDLSNYSMNFDFKWGVFHSNGAYNNYFDGTFKLIEIYTAIGNDT